MPKKPIAEAVHDSTLLTALELVTQEISVLRSAVDELREELAWEIRQLRQGPTEWKPLQLTSFPADATAPDFHSRVNAITPQTALQNGRVPYIAPTSFDELIQRLTSEPAYMHMGSDDWDDMDEFSPGEVVTIDEATFEWFVQYQLIVRQRDNWTLIDDRAGWFYLLWNRDNQHYLRLITDDEQQMITKFTSLKPVDEFVDIEQTNPSPATPVQTVTAQYQRSLW